MEKSNFREMFVVDQQIPKHKNGDHHTEDLITEKLHPFNITNLQSEEDGVIHDVKEHYYTSEVQKQLFLSLKPSEIGLFLSYHFKYAKDKDALLRFIKYDIWDWYHELFSITTNREAAVKDWIEKVTKQKDNPDIDEQSVDEILKEMFPTILEIETVKMNLEGAENYLKLTYVGTKKSFYQKLNKLRSAGYDRPIISLVFSRDCELRKSYGRECETMKKEVLYRKMGK